MTTPKHRTAPGASYFVTTKCWQSRTVFQIPEIAKIMLDILFHYRDRSVYLLHEFVVMPDHLHLLLTPGSTTSLEKTMQLIKGGSSHQIRKERSQRMEIWQQGFYDWTIRDAYDWKTKVDYIRMNPVRARLVQAPELWPYSSASGTFDIDPIPPKYLQTSAAKAAMPSSLTPELKLRPPKDHIPQGLKPPPTEPFDVGAKAPTPTDAKIRITSTATPGLKPRPPKEDRLMDLPQTGVKSART